MLRTRLMRRLPARHAAARLRGLARSHPGSRRCTHRRPAGRDRRRRGVSARGDHHGVVDTARSADDQAGGPWCLGRPADVAREEQEPVEHLTEHDQLERRHIDEPGDVNGDRHHDTHADTARSASDGAMHAAQHPPARRQDQGEAEDGPGGAAVVDELVDVDGEEADEREVDAEQRDQDGYDDGGAAIGERGRSRMPSHLPPQPRCEEHDTGAAEHDRRVEDLSREHRERPQATEVQLPPERVGGRRDGQEDADREQRGRGETRPGWPWCRRSARAGARRAERVRARRRAGPRCRSGLS